MDSAVQAPTDGHPLVFTANRLHDDQVVWLNAQGRWDERISAAASFHPEAAARMGVALAQRAARQAEVAGIYTVEVTAASGAPRPRHFSERLRLHGPGMAAATAVTLAL